MAFQIDIGTQWGDDPRYTPRTWGLASAQGSVTVSLGSLFDRQETHQLHSGVNSAVWYSHAEARHLARSSVREEDFVASFVTVGVENIARRWEPILAKRGICLSIAGVFCHGRPQVAFNSNGEKCQVELADLLVVHCHRSGQRTQSRAMLIQAKMSEDGSHALPNGDNQLELFTSWPAFSFVGNVLDSRLRVLKEVGQGSRYALIYDGHAFPEQLEWPHQCPWSACKASKNLSSESSFATLVTDLVLGKDGRSFSHVRPRGEWSRTINDLLRITGQRTFRARRLWLGAKSRIVEKVLPSGGELMFFAGGRGSATQPPSQSVLGRYFKNLSTVDGAAAPPEVPSQTEDDSEGVGMATLVIETLASA